MAATSAAEHTTAGVTEAGAPSMVTVMFDIVVQLCPPDMLRTLVVAAGPERVISHTAPSAFTKLPSQS